MLQALESETVGGKNQKNNAFQNIKIYPGREHLMRWFNVHIQLVWHVSNMLRLAKIDANNNVI